VSSLPVVLLHGAATTARIWDRCREHMDGLEVRVPQRAYSGRLDTEVADVADLCRGAVVAGVSGGATIGLALLMAGVDVAAAVLHEPAVGSLTPGLLDAVREAFERDGVPGFGATLYGPAWQVSDAPDDPAAVARDFAMFRAFEPAPFERPERALVTVGEFSPEMRHRSVEALARVLGVRTAVLPGAGHVAHLEAPAAFAALVASAAGAGPS